MPTTVSLAESVAAAVPAMVRQAAAAVPGAVVAERPGALTALTGAAASAYNTVVVTGSSRSDLMQAVRDADHAGAPYHVQCRVAYLPHVVPVLTQLGFRETVRMPAMVSIVAPPAPRPPELAIVRVDAPSTLDELVETSAAVFGLPLEAVRQVTTRELVEAPGVAHYVGYVNGRAVATATGTVHERGVGITNVTTLPDVRGRGYGAAMTGRAITGGFTAGATYAWLRASAAGLPLYRRMGFVEIDEWVVFGRPVPAQRTDAG